MLSYEPRLDRNVAWGLREDTIRLDALVNNAGVYGKRRGPEGARRMIETNFFGPLRVTEALL